MSQEPINRRPEVRVALKGLPNKLFGFGCYLFPLGKLDFWEEVMIFLVEDFVDLAGKGRLAKEEFEGHNPDAPNIDFVVVKVMAQLFGAKVIWRPHLAVSHVIRINRTPKVCDLDNLAHLEDVF